MFGIGLSGLLNSNSPASVPFSPLSVAGLHSYYTSDLCTVSSSTATVIPDQSGNSETSLTPKVAAPLYKATDSKFNGLPSFGSNFEERRCQGTFNNPLLQPATYYMVIFVSNSNGGKVFWRSNQGNFTNSAGFEINSSYEPLMLTQDNSQAVSGRSSIFGAYVSCAVYNSGGTSSLYLNDSTNSFMSSPGDGDIDGNGNYTMTIGSFDSEEYYWTAAAQYQGAHNQATRQLLLSYFGSKYGISTV